MHITSVDFIELSNNEAQCLLGSDNGVISIKCTSLLPADSDPFQHRVAWLQDALRQLRRMPEHRKDAEAGGFDNIALTAATAMRQRLITN